LKAASLAILLAAAGAAPAAEIPATLRLNVPTRKIAVYEPLEITLEGVPEAKNPFDPEEIAVDLEATGPGGRMIRLPAYYHRDFQKKLSGGREVLTAAGRGGWRLRFAAVEPGRHVLRVTAALGGKPVASGKANLQVTAGPARVRNGRGFVRVNETCRRYFRLDDGTPLFLNGLCACWHDGGGTYDYDRWLPAYRKAGINYIRIWMWHHAFGIEWDRNDRLRYRLDRAWTLDRVLDEARKQGIYIMLCLDYHGILEEKPDFWGGNNFWPRHPYNAENGGPARNQNEFFTSSEARKLYRKRLRYLVARWSAYTNLLAWQFFNEIDNVYRYLNHRDVVAWHRDMARYLREIDPYDHLITTSLTSQSERPEFWNLPEMDFAQYHSYNQKYPARVTARVIAGFFERYGKPIFVGEYGTDFRGWKPKDDPYLRALHQAIWSAPFCGAAGTGMSWWWQDIHRAGIYHHWSALASFLEGTAVATAEMKPLDIDVQGEKKVIPLAVSTGREALLWLLDPAHSWPEGGKDPDPPRISGVKVSAAGFAGETCDVEWWDTLRGKPVHREQCPIREGKILLSPPPFSVDIAARIRAR